MLVSDLYSKVLRIRVTEAQYSAMALQAAAEGHSGISNWARSQLVRTLGRSIGTVQAPEVETSSVGSVERDPEPGPFDDSQRPSGAALITDDEMKVILDDVLQGKG